MHHQRYCCFGLVMSCPRLCVSLKLELWNRNGPNLFAIRHFFYFFIFFFFEGEKRTLVEATRRVDAHDQVLALHGAESMACAGAFMLVAADVGGSLP